MLAPQALLLALVSETRLTGVIEMDDRASCFRPETNSPLCHSNTTPKLLRRPTSSISVAPDQRLCAYTIGRLPLVIVLFELCQETTTFSKLDRYTASFHATSPFWTASSKRCPALPRRCLRYRQHHHLTTRFPHSHSTSSTLTRPPQRATCLPQLPARARRSARESFRRRMKKS